MTILSSISSTAVSVAIRFPSPVHAEPWNEDTPYGLSGPTGSAEPWTAQFLYGLILALRPHLVIETGCYLGHTTAWIADAMERLGGGTLHAIDVDPNRIMQAKSYVDRLNLQKVFMAWHINHCFNAIMDFPPDSIDFAWVDDDHGAEHVSQELDLLIPKMAPGGVIALHDVFGEFNLAPVMAAHGGFNLALPVLHKSGGVGLWQRAVD